MKAKILLPFYDFKYNQKSSLIIHFVIALCVILSVVSILSIKSFFSYRESLNRINTNNSDILFLDIKYENYLDLLKYNDDNINNIFYTHNIGYAKLKESKINNKKYMLIEEMTPDGFINEKINIIGGRIPTSDTELLISSEFATNYGISINDVIDYDIGNIVGEDYYRLKTYDSSFDNYTFNSSINKEYTIVGIYNKTNASYIYNTGLSHYYAYTYMDERLLKNEDLIDISISLHNREKLSKDLETYKLLLKPTENNIIIISKDNTYYNNEYKTHIYFSLGVLLLIISTVAIKASFNYDSKKRKDFYAKEMCLGATAKNIKDSWYYLTYFLAISGIVIGVFLSKLLINYYIRFFVNTEKISLMLNEVFNNGIFLYAALIIFLAIIISYALTEKKILYVTALDYLKDKYEPIDAKYVRYDEITELKGEISKYIKSNIVLNHIKDNKLLFSLPFLIALLMTFISYSFILTKPIVDHINSKSINLTISINDLDSHKESLNSISRIEGVKDYLITGNTNKALYLKEKNDKEDFYSFLKVEDEYINYPVNIIIVENNKYDTLVKKDSDIILIPMLNILKNDEIISSQLFESEKKEEVIIYSDNNSYKLDDVLVYNIENDLLKIKNVYINIVMNEKTFKSYFSDLGINYSTIDLIINDHIFVDLLDVYAQKNNIDIDIKYNVESIIYNPNSNYIILAYLLGIFVIAILSLLLFTVVFASLNTYVKDREKEIALLRTIGINSKNINQIINGEYGDSYFVSALIGVILGGLLTNVLNKMYLFNELNNIASAKNLLLSYLILFALIVLVFFISLLFSTKKLRKSSPINFLSTNMREF